jgi:hypothetical protein
MSQNTTKNVLISVALIAFIISSGAFTVYQLAKRQTNTTNNSQVSNSINSVTEVNLPNTSLETNKGTNSVGQQKDLNIAFDAYICGVSITGFVDKPDIVQKLELTLIKKDKDDVKQVFTPKIDDFKNFKILVDDKIITDGVYKLEATATLTNQKTEVTETTVEFKKDCGNLIQNSAPSSVVANLVSNSTSSTVLSTQSETKAETPVVTNSVVSVAQSSQQVSIASELPRQTVKAPELTVTNSSTTSSAPTLVNNTNNPNAVRTGGLDTTAVITILMILLSTALAAKLKTRKFSYNQIFGKK